MQKGFLNEDGPFVHSLDEALSSFNVQRQAYHGGTFVGNHVHRSLQIYIALLLIHIRVKFLSLTTSKSCAVHQLKLLA